MRQIGHGVPPQTFSLFEFALVLRAVNVNDDCAVPVTAPEVLTDEIVIVSCHGDAKSDKENGFAETDFCIPDARTCEPVGTDPPKYHELCSSWPLELSYSSCVQAGSPCAFVFQSDSNST
jgi:hypothetical protein